MSFEELIKYLLTFLPEEIPSECKRVSLLTHADLHVVVLFSWLDRGQEYCYSHVINLTRPDYLGAAIYEEITNLESEIRSQISHMQTVGTVSLAEDNPQLQ